MDDFDPRHAALQYAAAVEAVEAIGRRTADGDDVAAGDALHAVVCGLVYVGDQIAAAVERPTALQLVLPTPGAVAAWRSFDGAPPELRYESALRQIVALDEHMGSPSPDDAMRAIARAALGLD